MANGDGYRLFGTETVSSAEAQGYWMRQVVSSHVSTAARDAAITAVPEGHIAVDRHTNRLSIGDQGNTWVPFGSFGDWETYTPTLTVVAGTNPTLGTGPVQRGRFTRHGTHATLELFLKFGTSMAAGSGIYRIDLPTTCQAASALSVSNEQIIGWGMTKDTSTGESRSVCARVVSAGYFRLEVHGSTGDMDNATPWAWADSDVVFNGTLTYETEPGPS